MIRRESVTLELCIVLILVIEILNEQWLINSKWLIVRVGIPL